MRKNSIKNTRINGEVQKELGNIIRREMKDPRISMITSVVAVEVSPDLKYCKAYISVLGDEKEQNETIKSLKNAEGFIRTKLAKAVNLRNTPEITFVLDHFIEYGVRMSKLIDEVNRGVENDELSENTHIWPTEIADEETDYDEESDYDEETDYGGDDKESDD